MPWTPSQEWGPLVAGKSWKDAKGKSTIKGKGKGKSRKSKKKKGGKSKRKSKKGRKSSRSPSSSTSPVPNDLLAPTAEQEAAAAETEAWRQQDPDAKRQHNIALLKEVKIFKQSKLSADEYETIADLLAVQEVQPGETIFEEGDKADRFYIIATGHLRVSRKNSKGEDFTVRDLNTNDLFGEIALTQDSDRTATIKARTQAVLLFLTKEDFKETMIVLGTSRGSRHHT